MGLLIKQARFTLKMSYLVQYAVSMGFFVTDGDAYRDKRATFPYAHKKSLHRIRLAEDKNFFMKWLTLRQMLNENEQKEVLSFMELKNPPDSKIIYINPLPLAVKILEPVGRYWETLDKFACWGGRFKRPDVDHFSFTHGGMK
jgi:hypothetical protein